LRSKNSIRREIDETNITRFQEHLQNLHYNFNFNFVAIDITKIRKKKNTKNTHKKKHWVTILEDVRCRGSTITPTLAKNKQIET
jgi:hypothetical protein